jgi:hypothetical protein
MRAAVTEIRSAIRGNLARWLAITIGIPVIYHLALLAAMMLRFGHWPNYARIHDVIEGIRLIIRGTPDPFDAVTLLGDEIWIEIGYLHPSFRIAEWSFNVMPARLAVLLLLGALVATYVVLGRRACAVPSRQGTTAVGMGATLVGLTSVTLTWVVCCSTPSWVVGLAMLGLGVSTSLALEPLGMPLTGAGFALLLAGILVRANSLPARAAPTLTRPPVTIEAAS